jgi:hypothetical protein
VADLVSQNSFNSYQERDVPRRAGDQREGGGKAKSEIQTGSLLGEVMPGNVHL